MNRQQLNYKIVTMRQVLLLIKFISIIYTGALVNQNVMCVISKLKL